MIELHVPLASGAVQGLASTVGYLTEGLDAVVVAHQPSKVYPGQVHLTLAGNARDLAIATERAAKVGGVID